MGRLGGSPDSAVQPQMPRRLIARVEKIIDETPRVKTFRLGVSDCPRFRAGQHVEIRLTAPDGYQARRSYSLASPPEQRDAIDLTIELIPEGEVSPYFHEVVVPGDEIEVRGPIGWPFTWDVDMGGPLLLIAGGSGIVPIMSMLRHRAAQRMPVPTSLVYSSRAWSEIIYRAELDRMVADDSAFQAFHTLTRAWPEAWGGYRRRIDAEMIVKATEHWSQPKHVYICGSDGFVDAAEAAVVSCGIDPSRVRIERFGPSAPPD